MLATLIPVKVQGVGHPGPINNAKAVILMGHGATGSSSVSYSDKYVGQPGTTFVHIPVQKLAADLVASGLASPVYLASCNGGASRTPTGFSFEEIKTAATPRGNEVATAQQLANELGKYYRTSGNPPPFVIGTIGTVVVNKHQRPGQADSILQLQIQNSDGLQVAHIATGEVAFSAGQSPQLHGEDAVTHRQYVEALQQQQRVRSNAGELALQARVLEANRLAQAMSASGSHVPFQASNSKDSKLRR